MRLSQLEIIGFKSFASKLDLKLSDGITAVVGPNGCGKSNIVDAIRWVLGEQRATALRGDRMEDIIFNGTTSRKPLGMAEVSLTIDNEQQRLPIEYSEVTITRRYFRSGDSEYFLNKVPCRLKDITDLLLDTGMGAHAYSIIEQGMVDAIVNGSPQDRRHLIEEAAGINKYKTRRRLAQRKLESTENDLIRIADILEEVEKQAGGLRRQVWKVERYNRLTQEQHEIEVACAYYEYLAIRTDTEPIREKIESLTKEKDLLTTKISVAETRVRTRDLELTEKQQVLLERQQDVNTCDQQIRELDGRVLVSRTRRSDLENRIESAGQESKSLHTELEHTNEQQAGAREELEGIAGNVEHARISCQKSEKEAQDFTRKVAEGKEQARILQRRRYELVQRQTEKRGEATAVESRLKELQERQQQFSQVKETLSKDLAAIGTQAKTAKTEYRKLTQSLEENLALKAELEDDIQAIQHRREERRLRKAELDTQLVARDREHGLLVQMRQRYEGFGQGVRALLADGPSIEGLRGTIAESMAVDDAYAPAVEAYLGDALQYIVATTTDDARAGIEYLNDNEQGKASFLLLDRLKTNNSNHTSRQLPADDPGIIGLALEYVKVPKKLESAVSHLLSHVVLVDDMKTALQIADRFNDGNGWQLLTRDGEVVDPTGVLTGGITSNGDTSLLSRTARIETLEEEMVAMRAEQQMLAEEITVIADKLNTMLERRTVMDRMIGEQQQSKMQLEKAVNQFEFQVSQLTERANNIVQEADRMGTMIREASSQFDTLKTALVQLEREREDAEDSDQEAQDILDQLEADGQKLVGEAQEARVTLISLESRGNELRTTNKHLQQEAERLVARLEQRRQEIASANGQVAELKTVLEQGEAQLKTLYSERRKKEIVRDAVGTEHGAIQEDIRALQFDIQETRKALTLVQEQIHHEELRDAELFARGNEIRKTLMLHYETDPENLADPPSVPGLEVFDTETAQGILLDIKRKIDDLGPINLAAINEYAAIKERVDFLTQQRDDLIEAKENLEKTIVKMNRAARARFLDTFEEIRQHFMKTFQTLFEGGEADLQLEEGDPLEAGIEIMARPPGKRLQSIALMSGGETALTAIALLFAIYLVKPSPFCIFDEVDAPLDDANIRRFASAIQQFSRDTQFLVVTHNKRTMEAADYLYGVTMEEPGLSKVVSVRLKGEQEDELPASSTNGSETIEESVRES